MYLNNFSVRVPEGHESGSYVELSHGQQYTLVLRNSNSARCDARIEIDGKHVGTWRIDSHSNITLQRPAHDDGRFTFYRTGSSEAAAVGEADIANSDRGLIRVTFTPEKPRVVYEHHHNPWWPYVRPYPPWDYGWPGTSYTSNVCHDTNYLSALSESSTRSAVPCAAVSATYAQQEAGVTGLSGHSNQEFYEAPQIEYDANRQTVIHLRLVVRDRNRNEPRPLTQFSTPVPPPVA